MTFRIRMTLILKMLTWILIS